MGLHIINQMPDGYHHIETCFYPIPWCDVLEIIPGHSLEMSFSGIEIPGNANDNLCIKAWNLLNKDFGIPPVQIHLHKVTPIGAGLGGGSSDAAFTLAYLNERFELRLTQQQLIDYATALGSDCAFFIKNRPVFATERGNVWQPISTHLEGYYLVVVFPNVHVSTAEAYKNCVKRGASGHLYGLLQKPVTEWKNTVENDFEKTVFNTYPAIKEVKNALYDAGAVYASMSGSGSAVYGIFEQEISELPQAFSTYKLWKGYLPALNKE